MAPDAPRPPTSEADPHDAVAPIPPQNEPGHHPPVEQDKPTGPPPTPRPGRRTGAAASTGPSPSTPAATAASTPGSAASPGSATRTASPGSAAGTRSAGATEGRTAPSADHPEGTVRFPFEFDLRLAPASAAVGVIPATAHVDLDDTHLHVRFGPWSLRTPLANVEGITPTGPYRWWKVAGPPHLSLADRGITFATTTAQGTCIRFREPVPAALPVPLLRHPAATVTLADPDGFVDALGARTAAAGTPA